MIPGGPRFVRYAYPPNALGYCGPDDHLALFEYGVEKVDDGGLRSLARDFDGAWPYLELIARATRRDPLDTDVVEAYWIGNGLLDRVDVASLGSSMEERFRDRAGTAWEAVVDAVASGARPHHGFHVFSVYPWVGLMRTGSREEPLRVLDRCRIRWGRVLEVVGDSALVESRPLVLESDRLTLGAPRPEKVAWAADGHGLAERLAPGDTVAMHWDWVCERLSSSSLSRLKRETGMSLRLANRYLAKPRTGVFA